MNNKMKGYVNINSEKYYKVVAEESKYMLFKSKDDFKKIEKLERMLYDLVRFAVSGKDTKEIILSRMNEIEKYLESLRIRPRVHHAGLLHAISSISMKLGQFKGSTPKLQKTNWFLFWIFLGGDR